MAENRIDPTVPGLFLVAFITLVFGVLGVLQYTDSSYHLLDSAGRLSYLIGIVFVVLAVSAIRFGNAFAAALFGFVAVALFAVETGVGDVVHGEWMLLVLVAVFFIVFAIIAFLIGAPKLLGILLLLVGVLYLCVGLFINGVADHGVNGDNIFGILFGIFGILAALVALYMAFALSTQKLPVF